MAMSVFSHNEVCDDKSYDGEYRAKYHTTNDILVYALERRLVGYILERSIVLDAEDLGAQHHAHIYNHRDEGRNADTRECRGYNLVQA